MVRGSISKGLVLAFTRLFEQIDHHGRRGWLGHFGQSVHLLECETKYLAISPVMDIMNN
jgi:hypothetical protein